MNGIKIYPAPSGWIYEVWFMGRAIAVGCCATLAAATREAARAARVCRGAPGRDRSGPAAPRRRVLRGRAALPSSRSRDVIGVVVV
ncbi:MAG: hypothetical protein QOK44_3536 [Betaproteobacteria bacterium]|nr:hypothetical protein [Betaproteobacteria bacterium]